jgi:hypothetical protein
MPSRNRKLSATASSASSDATGALSEASSADRTHLRSGDGRGSARPEDALAADFGQGSIRPPSEIPCSIIGSFSGQEFGKLTFAHPTTASGREELWIDIIQQAAREKNVPWRWIKILKVFPDELHEKLVVQAVVSVPIVEWEELEGECEACGDPTSRISKCSVCKPCKDVLVCERCEVLTAGAEWVCMRCISDVENCEKGLAKWQHTRYVALQQHWHYCDMGDALNCPKCKCPGATCSIQWHWTFWQPQESGQAQAQGSGQA